MTFDPYRVSEECVSEDDLRELIEKWRDFAAENIVDGIGSYDNYAHAQGERAAEDADQLEEVLEDK